MQCNVRSSAPSNLDIDGPAFGNWVTVSQELRLILPPNARFEQNKPKNRTKNSMGNVKSVCR